MLTFFDAFSGVGGFRLGFEREGFECVGYSEVDKFALKLYSEYFKDVRNYGDITKINPKELPDFDVITAGIPCQPFSYAGKRKGLKDTRGLPLWRSFFRIVRYKKPKIVVIENVKGLLSSNGGRDFAWAILQMAELGYGLEWMVINSKDFGVPQNRERVFIVGYIGGDGRPKIFPIREDEKVYYKPPKTERKFQTIPNISSTIITSYPRMGSRSPCIIIDGGNDLTVNTKIRKFTPLEVFRLQGFPDDIVEVGRRIGISDTQLYKMAGNSVTVPIVQSIARKIKKVFFK